MTPTTLLQPADNPYQSPATWNTAPVAGGYTDDQIIELRAFVGPRSDHYLRKWLPRLQDPAGGDVGISWIALFFPALWCGYRKMYRTGFLVLIVGGVLAFVPPVLFIKVLEAPTTPLPATLIVAVLFNLVCALYGNAWYLKHAESHIARARQEGLIGEQMLRILSRRGGTSWLGLAAMWILGGIIGAITGVAELLVHMIP